MAEWGHNKLGQMSYRSMPVEKTRLYKLNSNCSATEIIIYIHSLQMPAKPTEQATKKPSKYSYTITKKKIKLTSIIILYKGWGHSILLLM